jgi:hypothetical protein
MNEEHDAFPTGIASDARVQPASSLNHEEAQRLGSIRRCLEEALATAEDDRLAESEIVDIVASAGELRLTVVIAGAPQAVLDRAAGWLRGELAAGMNRRRVPALHLVAVAPRGPGGVR